VTETMMVSKTHLLSTHQNDDPRVVKWYRMPDRTTGNSNGYRLSASFQQLVFDTIVIGFNWTVFKIWKVKEAIS